MNDQLQDIIGIAVVLVVVGAFILLWTWGDRDTSSITVTPTPQINTAPLRQRIQRLEADVAELRGWMETGVVMPTTERVD